jgi:hypothetical protein
MRSLSEPTARSDGRKDRPVQTGEVFAPKVIALEGDHLLCDANRNSINAPGAGLLEGFLKVADAEPDEILKFARKWGALGIRMKPAPGLRSHEPVAAWSDLAIRFRALHRIGAELNRGSIGAARDWRALGSRRPAANRTYTALEEARFSLISIMGRLVRDAKLCPRLYWNKSTEQWQIDFDTHSRTNLFAVLVFKLMVVIADKEGCAICSGCHETYFPEKQPSVGRRNYCKGCRLNGVPFRDSKRDQRRRKREAKAKAKTGK